MLLSKREKRERHYAFNIDNFKYRGSRNKKKLNFDNIDKGFYDDLINYDEQLKKEKQELDNTKSNGLKELVYTNVKVPDVWKNKITYHSDLYNTMSDDKYFVSYLGKGTNKIYMNTENKSTRNIRIPNQKLSNHKIQLSNNIIYKHNLSLSPNQFNLKETIQNKKDSSNLFRSILKKSNKEKNIKKEKELINEDNKTNKESYSNFIHLVADNNKEVLNILEEYKQAFPINLPRIISKEKDNDKENKNKKEEKEGKILSKKKIIILKTKEENLSKEKINIKENEKSIRKKKDEMTKAEVFKTTIYNNLLNKNIIKSKFEDPTKTLKCYKNVMEEKIEINDPDIKKKLEDINYYGPFYPYCFIGKKKNLLFYNTMEKNQCINLLNYLRKIRTKSKIGIQMNNDNNNFEDDDDDDDSGFL